MGTPSLSNFEFSITDYEYVVMSVDISGGPISDINLQISNISAGSVIHDFQELDSSQISSLVNGMEVGILIEVPLPDANFAAQLEVTDTNSQSASIIQQFNIKDDVNRASEIVINQPLSTISNVYELNPNIFNKAISFSDGLGRKYESITVKSSPMGKDIITPSFYDEIGNESKSYLPYTSDQDNGSFVALTPAYLELASFYNDPNTSIPVDSAPFSDKQVEKSPISRLEEQGSPGDIWQPNEVRSQGNTVRTNHLTNYINSIRKWNDDGTAGGFYDESELTVIETIDENGHSSKEVKDKTGNTVVKISTNSSIDMYSYNVYDKHNNLIYIIPPECYAEMETNSSWDITEALKNKWVTWFEYDNLNRCIIKSIPEMEPIYNVYDNLDRLVLIQDGNLRSQNKWLYNRFDMRGRKIQSGILSSTASRSDLQNVLDAYVNNSGEPGTFPFYETRDEYTRFGYSHLTYPPADHCDVLEIIFYDDYNYNYDGHTTESFLSDTDPLFASNEEFNRIKGKVTHELRSIIQPTKSSKVYFGDSTYTICPSTFDEVFYKGNDITLAAGFETNTDQIVTIGSGIQVPANSLDCDWVTSTYYYDQYGRVIQSQRMNHLEQLDVTNNSYNFTGDVTASKTMYNYQPGELCDNEITTRYEYDHAKRLEHVYHKVNSQNEILMIENNYNELGQLVEKNLHSEDNGLTFLQSVDFEYNIRGWLTKINGINLQTDGDLFGMEFYYVTGVSGLSVDPQYNGNISAVKWNVDNDNYIRAYGYNYDDINQLTEATYADYYQDMISVNDLYSVDNISYDLNGNIQSIRRKSDINNNRTTGVIDALTFDYGSWGNLLTGVDDAVTTNYGEDFFDNGSSYATEAEYNYDDNGNLIEDKNKSIDISYNYQNLPIVVDFGNGNRIEWIYDNTGSKLRKSVYSNNTLSFYKDYVNGCEYKDGNLEFISTSEGKVVSGSTAFDYVYNLKDHLGNVRVSFSKDATGNAEIVQQDHYYPFGMRMANLSENDGNDNNYLYNNKEFENDHDLSWYHYGARYYDPQICRWLQVDPADEFYSAYVYCGNMPIIAIDPDGREIVIPRLIQQKIFTSAMPPELRESISFNSEGVLDNDLFSSGFDALVNPDVVASAANYISNHEETVYVKKMEKYYYGVDLEIEAEKVPGVLGHTYYQDETESGCIEAFVNESYSGSLAKALAHELFGHAYFKLLGKDHQHRVVAQGERNVDVNYEFKEQYKSAETAAQRNEGVSE